MWRNFVFGSVLVFLFVFDAKTYTTNSYRNGSSDVSFRSPFSRDSNIKKILKKFPSVEKNRFEMFVFWSS